MQILVSVHSPNPWNRAPAHSPFENATELLELLLKLLNH